MWHTPTKPIPKKNIDAEHMRVIVDAVIDCEQDFDVRSAKLYTALDYFEKQSTSTWGLVKRLKWRIDKSTVKRRSK